MPNWIRGRLTFANLVSLTALFVALGGTAMAAFIITSNDQVGPNTISGHNPPRGDGSNLIAGSVDATDLARSVAPCRTDGVLTVNTGDPARLVCVARTLRVYAQCRVHRPTSSKETQGRLLIRTNHALSFWRSDFGGDSSFDVSESPAALLEVAAGPSNSRSLEDTSFTVGDIAGNQLAGDGAIRATKISPSGAGFCDFVVGASE